MALNKYQLSMDEVALLSYNAGFRATNLVTAIAVVWAESGGNAWAININSSPGKPTHGSIDIGLAQFNTYWWSTHKANDLMKPDYSMALMFKASRGNNFSFWSAFVHGMHRPYIPYAEAVVARNNLV